MGWSTRIVQPITIQTPITMNEHATDLFSKRASFTIRWLLGVLFIAIAYTQQDAAVLYFFGGALLVSSFFRPKRCAAGACDL